MIIIKVDTYQDLNNRDCIILSWQLLIKQYYIDR